MLCGTQSLSSVQFSCSAVSDSLWPHESQHARPPCPSPTPRVYPNSCPSSRWCHPATSSSAIPFAQYVQLFATPWTIACQAPLSMGTHQARILEWVVMASSRGSSQPRYQTQTSCITGRFFTNWATREALLCLSSYIFWVFPSSENH